MTKKLGPIPNLVGKKIMDAKKLAAQAGYTLRVSTDISKLDKVALPCITVEVIGALPNITITKQQNG